MGIFTDHAPKYFEAGIKVLPCHNKAPIIGRDWQKYCDEPIPEKLFTDWVDQYKNADQIGLPMGKSTGFVGFDFDYKFNDAKTSMTKQQWQKDKKIIEAQILALLPPSPAIKQGAKGCWTRFYKWNPDLANVSCSRNGLGLFDLLAWHKQTILPPSAYPEQSEYKWLGLPIQDCIDEIPELDMDCVYEIQRMFSEGCAPDSGGRHRALFDALYDIISVTQDKNELINFIVKKDLELNPDKPYLSDKKHHRSHDPKVNAENWVSRIIKWHQAKKHMKVQEPVGPTGWDYFFDRAFPFTRKDVLSRAVYVKLNAKDQWTPATGAEPVYRAYAAKAQMPVGATTDQLARWAMEKQNLEFLCDLPKWDGIDRIEKFGAAIKSPYFNADEITKILKHWGSGIFRRLDDTSIQNRCVILKGDQGIGKDSLVSAMFKDFKPYYEATTLAGTQKDILEIVSRLLVVHIEEFDQTAKLDVAFLKSLITQPSSFFRESYGRSPNQKSMSASFISTANVDNIFRDPTGNRRFIVIPVDRIEWNYPKGESLQVMAQLKELANEGAVLPREIEEKIAMLVAKMTPDDNESIILEIYEHKFMGLCGGQNHPGLKLGLKSAQISDDLSDIAKTLGVSFKKVQSTIKSAGLSYRFVDGVRYFKDIDTMREYLAMPIKRSPEGKVDSVKGP